MGGSDYDLGWLFINHSNRPAGECRNEHQSDYFSNLILAKVIGLAFFPQYNFKTTLCSFNNVFYV